jgi:hypothetical protein
MTTRHTFPMSYTKEGRPSWQPALTSTSNTAEKIMPAPPSKVIPVIFIPGIMGSNLCNKGGEMVWRPDTMGLTDVFRSPAERQRRLDPATTQIDTRMSVGGKVIMTPPGYMPVELADKRRWGSIYWKSYGGFVQALEDILNFPAVFDFTQDKVFTRPEWKRLIDEGYTLPDGKTKLKLSQSEFDKLTDYHFPIWCAGYNWLQCNGDSGKKVAAIIDDALTDAKHLFGDKAASKAILVTHSMGGLVARAACHPTFGNAEKKVIGIVHGVMPAIGAGTAYRRILAGFETKAQATVKESGTAAALGNVGQDVTPVLAYSPGGLELLPNKRYMNQAWLKIQKADGTFHTIGGDPYKSIYREKSKWWRLINQDWLDPAEKFKTNGKLDSTLAWSGFSDALKAAEEYHNQINGSSPYYHPNTYAHYGNDENFQSWGEVHWMHNGAAPAARWIGSARNDEQAINAADTHNDGRGTVQHIGFGLTMKYTMSPQTSRGDGTVPAESAADPKHCSGVQECHPLTGFGHQESYDPANQTFYSTLYSIAKIVQKADW